MNSNVAALKLVSQQKICHQATTPGGGAKTTNNAAKNPSHHIFRIVVHPSIITYQNTHLN